MSWLLFPLLLIGFQSDLEAAAPYGFLDRAGCDGIFGWSKDPDVAVVAIHFYADGPAGQGRFLGYAIADQHRPDVGNHSFALPASQYPQWLRDGRRHTIYAHAIDDSGGPHPLLSDPGSRESVQCSGAPTPTPGAETKFGMFYFLWHCIVSDSPVRKFPIFNSEQLIAANNGWTFVDGAGRRQKTIGLLHWWDEPQEGYYCLSRDDDVLKTHAQQLADAGIDFVVMDSTNHPYRHDPPRWALESIVDPFEALVRVWSDIPNAPKIVPYVPVIESDASNNRMVDLLVDSLEDAKAAGDDLFLYHEGKPLLLVVENTFPELRVDERAVAQLANRYTIRRAWALFLRDQSNWSYLEPCQNGFRESLGRIPCQQNVTVRGGAVEQLSIAPAYSHSYISYAPIAVPKYHGKTFVQQFARLWDFPHNAVPFALITGWNEWTAIRWCVGPDGIQTTNCAQAGAFEFWPDGNPVFVDSYRRELNRDLEPVKASGAGSQGDYYYRLMKKCIGNYKQGARCSTDSVTSPFIQNWHDPNGFVDPPSRCNARGWVKDADAPTTSLAVHIYLDNPAGAGTFAAAGTANRFRPDVGGNFGYEISIPRRVGGRGSHNRTIWVHAIDPSGEGNNVLLHQSGRMRVNCR